MNPSLLTTIQTHYHQYRLVSVLDDAFALPEIKFDEDKTKENVFLHQWELYELVFDLKCNPWSRTFLTSQPPHGYAVVWTVRLVGIEFCDDRLHSWFHLHNCFWKRLLYWVTFNIHLLAWFRQARKAKGMLTGQHEWVIENWTANRTCQQVGKFFVLFFQLSKQFILLSLD